MKKFIIGILALCGAFSIVFVVGGFLLMWKRDGSISAAFEPSYENLSVVDGSRGALSYNEQVALYNGLANKLTDPVSAQVRKLRKSTIHAGGICGEVNAKNRLGGYVGFLPFTGTILENSAYLVIADRGVLEHMRSQLAKSMADFGC